MNYLFEQININAIEVSISSICSNTLKTADPFESAVFSFIADWFSNKQQFIQETSGSTGIPKKISLKREQLLSSAKATLNFLSVKPGGKALICMDPTFIAGKMMLVRALEANLQIIAVNPSANPLQSIPIEIELELVAMVPYQVHCLFQDENLKKAKSIQHLLIGGAPLSILLEEELVKHKINAYETFGMTETISHIALRKMGRPYFKTLPGIEISIDDRSCLAIKADYLSENSITSNDIVELIDNESFKWLGRWDNVINSGGIKIIPEQEEPIIAKVLQELGVDNRFYLGSRENAKLGMEAILFIESENQENIPVDFILKKLKEKLKPYHAPMAITTIAAFAETKNGKIIRA
jgi:o-succinylbenzoate---CoA ligase